MLGLLFMSFILFWGGGPSRDRLGFRCELTTEFLHLLDFPLTRSTDWQNPGAANAYLEEGQTK